MRGGRVSARREGECEEGGHVQCKEASTSPPPRAVTHGDRTAGWRRTSRRTNESFSAGRAYTIAMVRRSATYARSVVSSS